MKFRKRRLNREYQMRSQITSFILLSVLFFTILSCSTDSSSDGFDNDFQNIEGFDASLGSETTYVAEDIVEAGLVSSDTENHRYAFDADVLSDADLELREGEILLIPGVALRRISSVSESGGQVEVATEYATLNEAFENADISWDEPLEFTPEMLEDAVFEFMGKEVSPKLESMSSNGETKSFGFELKRGDWEVEGQISAIGREQVNLIILPRYNIGEASGAFRFEMTIGNMSNEAAITIRDHETEKFTYNNKDLGGTAEFEFVGAGGVGPDFIYPDPSGPAALRVRVPINIGPIPAVLSVGVRFVVRIKLEGNSTAHMEGSISYTGSAGFEVEGPSVETVDNLDNASFSEAVGNAAGDLGVTVDAQYGVGYPDIALELFGETIVPYLRPEFYIGAGLTWGPLCTTLSRRFLVNAGLNLSFLGVSINDYSKTLIENELYDYSPEGCGGQGKISDDPLDRILIFNPYKANDDYEIPYILDS